MNRHPAALVQISPLHLRQVLFLSLALMLTLVAGQLHHAWQTAQVEQRMSAQAQELAQFHASRAVAQAQNLASAHSLPVATSSTPSVKSNAEFATPRAERWVF